MNSDQQNTYFMIREMLTAKHPLMEDAEADKLAKELLAEKTAQLEGAELVLKIIAAIVCIIVFAVCFWWYEIRLLFSIGLAILSFPAIAIASLPIGYVLGKRATRRFEARISSGA